MAKQGDLQIYGGTELAFALQTELVQSKAKRAKRAGSKLIKVGKSPKGEALKIAGKGTKRGVPRGILRAFAKVVRAPADKDAENLMVVVVNTEDTLLRDTIRNVVARAPDVVEARHREFTDDAVDRLLSIYMPTPPDAEVTQLLLDSNAKARKRFFESWPCATSKQLAESAGHSSRNPSMTAARWKSAGKVFSVKHAGTEYFPMFQFSDGQPVETVSEVIKKLNSKKSSWQLAFWFTSPNGWLGGKVPATVLEDRDAVVNAAAKEADFIAG